MNLISKIQLPGNETIYDLSVPNAIQGQGYAECYTATNISSKIANMSGNYIPSAGGYVTVMFENDVADGATLKINDSDSYAIVYKYSPITSGIIHASDSATFIFADNKYHLVGLNRINEGSAANQVVISEEEPSSNDCLIWIQTKPSNDNGILIPPLPPQLPPEEIVFFDKKFENFQSDNSSLTYPSEDRCVLSSGEEDGIASPIRLTYPNISDFIYRSGTYRISFDIGGINSLGSNPIYLYYNINSTPEELYIEDLNSSFGENPMNITQSVFKDIVLDENEDLAFSIYFITDSVTSIELANFAITKIF